MSRLNASAWHRLAAGIVSLLFAVGTSADETEEGFQPLLNGRDLSGWVRVNTAPSTWTVEDGLLICSGKPTGELRTERMYQNFILELEWRHTVPKGNAGVFVWADEITAPGVPFHRSIEVQVLENDFGNTESHTTHGDIFPIHGAHMTPINGRGGDRAFPTENLSLPSPQWNHYRITCNDGDISLAVNGKLVTQGKDCSPSKGYICLESEGGVVHYRNVRIKELPDTPVDDNDVAIADRGYRCLYSGVDFSGWMKEREEDAGWQVRDWTLGCEPSSDGASDQLTTTESFGDMDFIFDVRLTAHAAASQVLLRGAAQGAINLSPDNPLWQAGGRPAGQWNRFEGTLRGDQLTLKLNGKQVFEQQSLPDLPTSGPLQLVSAGGIEVANIYVRTLAAP